MKKSSCKVPPAFVVFQLNLSFLGRFSKKVQISNFIQLRSLGAKLSHAEKQADMAKLIVAFHNFTNAPKDRTKHKD